MAAIVHVLRLIRTERLVVPDVIVDGLEVALDLAFDAYVGENVNDGSADERSQ